MDGQPQILAIQIKRIGDLILTVPALARLKREVPGARVTLVTLGAAGQLAPAIAGLGEHLNYRYRRPNLALWRTLADRRFEVALDFNGSDRSALMTLLSGAETAATYTKRAASPFRERIYSHTSNAPLKTMHTIDHMVALLDAIGLPPATAPEPLRLAIPAPVQAAVDRRLEALLGKPDAPFAVIHAGTARDEKYWEASRWAAVIDHLEKERGLRCVLTGGTDTVEAAHLGAIASLAGVAPAVLAGKLSLLETAAVIRRSTIALGVDTAAMHLAAAFERPQIVLYGPTNPFHWRPRHPNARVILSGESGVLPEAWDLSRTNKRSMNRIETRQVIDAIESWDPASLTAAGGTQQG
ncbi:MAG: glycosyltransferase family 9 protein [Verrucomicrobiae bacterium]|nr:glycosyltransferase family 9 protein [Verrucomicrobiae bacterium]